MSSFALLSARARAYVVTVAVLGAAALAGALHQLWATPVDVRWLVLVALTLLTSSITVKVPSVAATISVSEAFVFSSVILFGWPAGTILASLDGLVISHWLQRKRNQPSYRVVFNATAPALSTFAAAGLYELMGAPSASAPDFHVTQILLPLCVFAGTYFVANTSLLALAIALEQRLSAWEVWRQNFMWLWLNFFSGASMAALLVSFAGRDGSNALGAIWIVLPLLAITYFTYKTSMARIEDANFHVDKLNALYLSTVETLAMAIDAKDQITHGHIRRVQQYAVQLAKEIGITDESQLRAIGAAALLHDMGKLAVPEYILNKPGALTPAEFERMKTHAAVGADILSAIEFPYPVVPIVRHHHENWDGTGYPAGISGTDIPIGARVLSVVDCFDALTSDRPYRPRLSDDDALEVIRERRGTMYDPLVVDSFLDMYKRVRHMEREAGRDSGRPLEAGTLSRSLTPLPRLAAISASAGESRAMYRLIQRLAAQSSLSAALQDVVDEVAALVPATVVAFYSALPDGDLEVTQVAGANVEWLQGRRGRLGEKVVGWSASSGRSVLNADAQGEFGELARAQSSPIRSCLTVPVALHADRLGVIAAFSAHDSGFKEEDQRVVEAIVKHVAPILDRLKPRDPSVPLSQASDTLELTPMGMIACRCRPHSAAGTENVGIALAVIRRHLGSRALTQLINSDDIFVGVGAAEVSEIDSLAASLRETLLGSDLIQLGQHVVVATAPKDGTNLEHLLYACRQRLAPPTERRSRVH